MSVGRADLQAELSSVLEPAAAWKPERSYPTSMVVHRAGDLLIATSDHLLRWNPGLQRPAPFVGSTRGFAGDGGPASNAKFAFAEGLAINSSGDIFVADYQNCRIRRIDHRTMVIGTIAGTGKCKSTGDGGPAVKASMNYPQSIAVDAHGNVFFVDGNRVRRID
jgi:sugar lactone lactonase YvrE